MWNDFKAGTGIGTSDKKCDEIINAYKKGDYTTVEMLANQHLRTYKKVKSTPKVAFWLAKTAMKQNKISEAHNILKDQHYINIEM